MARALRRWLVVSLALSLALGLPACKRDPAGQLPASSGEASRVSRGSTVSGSMSRSRFQTAFVRTVSIVVAKLWTTRSAKLSVRAAAFVAVPL